MITNLKELAALKEAMQPKMAVRKGLTIVGEDEYKRHVLICGGTGCTSSSSMKIADALEAGIAKRRSRAE